MSRKHKTALIYGALVDPAYGASRPLFALTSRLWYPPTDVYESRDRAVIRMELAGVASENLSISAEGRRLRISGRRCEPKGEDLLCYHLSEVQYGRFERIFEFPFMIKMNEIRVSYEQGFLIVEVPKKSAPGTTVTITIIAESQREF